MKYQINKSPRRRYHIITVMYVTLTILLGLVVMDCLFNYGKLTIEIMYRIIEGVQSE